MIYKHGSLKPLLWLMDKMCFQDDIDAYATVVHFVRMRALRLGGYRPLMLYGPRACGKSRMSRAIRKVLGIKERWTDHILVDRKYGCGLDEMLRADSGCVVFRDVFGRAPWLKNWLVQRYVRRQAIDVIIETSDPDTFLSIGRLDLCDVVVFDGL